MGLWHKSLILTRGRVRNGIRTPPEQREKKDTNRLLGSIFADFHPKTARVSIVYERGMGV